MSAISKHRTKTETASEEFFSRRNKFAANCRAYSHLV